MVVNGQFFGFVFVLFFVCKIEQSLCSMEAGKIRKKQKERLVLLFNDMIFWCSMVDHKNNKARKKDHDLHSPSKYKYKGHYMIKNDSKFHFGLNFSAGPPPKAPRAQSGSGVKNHGSGKSGTYQSRRTKFARGHSDPYAFDGNNGNSGDIANQGFWFGTNADTRHVYCSQGIDDCLHV